MMKTMVVVPVAMFSVACADAGPQMLDLTQGELSQRLESGAQRIEVDLRADGTVREIQVEFEGAGHSEQLAGRVLSLDVAAGLMQVEFLGAVDFNAAGRFRTEDESRVDKAAWLADAEAALSRGETVWVDARGFFGEGLFLADEVRWEDDADREVEADVSLSSYDEVNGTLTIGHLTFDVAGVPIRAEDDEGDDDDSSDDDDSGSSDDDSSDDSSGSGSDDDSPGSDDDGSDDDDSTDDSSGSGSSDDDSTDDSGDDMTDDQGGDSADGNTDDDDMDDDHGGDSDDDGDDR